ncbi:MAG: TRAP transporter substrate-binding protein [Deltaproteobacteria bacterium]|nr:TRAP transporter substrate-binding protein [Deltaproteobacteria bacterium]
MVRLSRFVSYVAVAAVALAGFIVVGPSAGSTEELKIAHFMSPKHPMDRFLMRPWAKEIAKITNNDLTARIYPGGELGKGPRAQFKRAVDGVADITFGLQGYTSKQFPRTTLIELPAVAPDGIVATEKLWDIYDRYLAGEYKRVKTLAIWGAESPVLMTKNKAIRKISDIKGLKIRTPSKAQAALIRALGATPVAMPVTRMYNALNTGVVDALMVPPSVILSFKIGEVAKYYTTGLPFGRSPFFLLMNLPKWESLSASQKAAINKTTGRGLSIKGAKFYEKAGAKGLKSVSKGGKHEVITFSPDEVKKGTAILLKARIKIVADLEKKGIPAKAILAALGARN